MDRPEFDSIKDFEEFNKYYWYREELIKICKAHGIKADGSKIELYKVIEAYFAGEQILHTNYRHMWDDRRIIRDRGNARDFRGGYDPWNPIWITGFFLVTAADFKEMGMDSSALFQ